MEAHFVTFYSPGTFMPEETTLPIESWDIDLAVNMSKEIEERHGARPYCFQFVTRSRSEDELDSKVVAKSGNHFLGGAIETREEIVARNLPDERILRANMQGNDIKKVITNCNSWKVTIPFTDEDVLLEVK